MRSKLHLVPILSTLFTIAILYTIGNLFDLSLFSLRFIMEIDNDGFLLEGNISFIPIIIGIVVGLLVGSIINRKNKRGDKDE